MRWIGGYRRDLGVQARGDIAILGDGSRERARGEGGEALGVGIGLGGVGEILVVPDAPAGRRQPPRGER